MYCWDPGVTSIVGLGRSARSHYSGDVVIASAEPSASGVVLDLTYVISVGQSLLPRAYYSNTSDQLEFHVLGPNSSLACSTILDFVVGVFYDLRLPVRKKMTRHFVSHEHEQPARLTC